VAGRLLAASAVAGLLAAPGSLALAKRPRVHVSTSSSQRSSHTATIGVDVSASSSPGGGSSGSTSVAGGSPAPSPPPPPTIAADSPLLANPAPAGPGSYWYSGPSGEACIYAPSASPGCFAIVAPGTPPLDVAGTAASLSAQLDLSLAPIEASPAASRDGLTGAPSWFWLDGAPASQTLSVSLAGETVSVTAQPGTVVWSFGDGDGAEGGAGIPFRDGPIPDDAVTHVYETRCLPGDRGFDPFVLASCGADGYTVSAEVDWTISYDGQGPESESGTLPSRTTEVELVYPVSEVRAFLEGGA
jgi:hypothetical protein